MSSNPPHALFVISVAAELSGLHPQTLRIYERRGLVEPHRTPGGTRRYSQADIDRLQLIQTLTEQGLNLEGVKKVMDLQNRIVALE
ncbi:MAG: MerR family transcriptional regulator, partial [Acidimicrobiia bacterium]|nr:MerR family transcriptional regulator [Acidimicrobiia bacterium]